jgi:hypothetical protein
MWNTIVFVTFGVLILVSVIYDVITTKRSKVREEVLEVENILIDYAIENGVLFSSQIKSILDEGKVRFAGFALDDLIKQQIFGIDLQSKELCFIYLKD